MMSGQMLLTRAVLSEGRSTVGAGCRRFGARWLNLGRETISAILLYGGVPSRSSFETLTPN